MASKNSVARGPGILTGTPRSKVYLPVVRPVLPDLESIEAEVRDMLATGALTNTGPYTERLEAALAEDLGLPNPAVVGNGTVAMMLAFEALLPRAGGEVIVPSFTFAATANAVLWAGFEPVFADIQPATMTLDPEAVEALIGPRTVAIVPVHPFGGLCDIAAFDRLAADYRLTLIYDSAQAVGVRRHGRLVGGCGQAETFSLHTTKVMPAGEGGIVTSNDPGVADRIRKSRNFGLGGSGAICGLNGKITEFSAVIGLRSLDRLETNLFNRRKAAAEIKRMLEPVPGLSWQHLPPAVETNAQNLALRIDADAFGLDADQLAAALRFDNVNSRRYFNPCLHQLPLFAACRRGDMATSELVTSQCLSLPVYSDMTAEEVEVVADAVAGLHDHADAVARLLAAP